MRLDESPRYSKLTVNLASKSAAVETAISQEPPRRRKSFLRRCLPSEWRRIPEALKWRSPTRVLLLSLREILRPLLYWYVCDIVENDLTRPSPSPYAERTFNVRFYNAGDGLEVIAAIIVPMGEIQKQEIAARFRRGDVIAVAYAGEEAVGYGWMTFSSGMELVMKAVWVVRPNEAVFYGSFVLPLWRGQGIHSWLDLEMNNYARQRGILRTLGSISRLNSGSMKLAKRQGKPVIMTVFVFHIRGLKWTYRKAFGSPFSSYFRVEP
jgi:GNAT superfamily N-acetyltransferase